MSQITFSGPLKYRAKTFLALNRIAIATFARHAMGRKIAPDWDANIEIGIRFMRRQFTVAMTHADIVQGRLIFDCVQPETDHKYEVTPTPCDAPEGMWYTPTHLTSTATLLYLHGGGYAFHAGVSRRFAAMLAHHTGARVFAPDYRLTPEHPHPAQAEDALAAWRYVTDQTPANQIVVIGDSAGGHMSLMLLQTLQDKGLAQPGLCVGICPWTDIGDRGDSLRDNNQFDLVQGWMALKFGEWLDPDGTFGRTALSPIAHNFAGLAPIYLLAGGREVLRDMIVDFAQVQRAHGADVMLDLWADMPHVFPAYDTLKTSSTEALARICSAITAHVEAGSPLVPLAGVTQD